MLLTDILKDNVEKFGDKPAFTMKFGFRTKTFNYSQVYDLAQKTALLLKSCGVNKDDKVLIFAPNSPYWGIVFWATMLRGAVLVPVNIQSTPSMIEKILEQTGAKVIFKSRFLQSEFSFGSITLDIEFLEDLLDGFNADSFVPELVKEDDLVEILYTSGTTGDPKGVMLTHKNIFSNIQAISNITKLRFAKERLLSVLPLTHIFEQTMGFFLPQAYASHIIYAHSYSAILDLIYKYKITKFLVVPELLKVFMSKIKDEYSKKGFSKLFEKFKNLSLKANNKYVSRLLFYSVHKKFGNKLDTIACGGAFLDPELEKEWSALGITILQGYGLTETSPLVSCNTYSEKRFGSVGKIVENVELKIDKDGQVLVKGPGVFSGYFKNEEKTTESFTKDGFFKTGDVGEIDKDGYLFLKGRKKYLIIGPGGQNVFPEDIELELNKLDGVKDSCVLGLPTKSGMVKIFAVLLLDNFNVDNQRADAQRADAQRVDSRVIVEKANSNLASYQQINDFTVWEQEDFPRSATKKIKKEEVLKVILEQIEGKPKVELKLKATPLMQLLSNISGVDLSDLNENKKIVSELQLDSLMRVELILRIEDRFGVLIDESLITNNTTVGQLQEIIDKREPAKKFPALKKWPRNWFIKAIRAICQFKVILFSKIFFRLEVQGLENLENINGPVLFMPNHISYADPLAIIMALPYKVRKKLSFAAARDVLYKEYIHVAWLADLLFNSFPFPRTNGEGIKLGLDYMGQLIDKGYSVVVFPEGKMSETGELLTLKKGAGLMAVEMKCPVIPIKIEGTSDIIPYGKFIPRKIGKIVIKIGKPIDFKADDSYEYVTSNIEEALIKL